MGIYSIAEKSAVADGKTVCTNAIQSAIDAAAAAGGGTVLVPPGMWCTGTLVLKSFVTLHLEPGSTLSGSTQLADYPEHIPALRSFTDCQVSRSLIYSEDADHIAITGSGTIDGNGGSFPQKYGDTDKQRPYLIRIISCRDVRVENVHLRNSAMWMQHYMDCDRVQVRGISVYNHSNYKNDGLDIDGCRDVNISDCQIDADDDGLCLKGTFQKSAENITITNCVLRSHCTALKFGTESCLDLSLP